VNPRIALTRSVADRDFSALIGVYVFGRRGEPMQSKANNKRSAFALGPKAKINLAAVKGL
jgi:hypothetical protein